jgi:hypothetical protein
MAQRAVLSARRARLATGGIVLLLGGLGGVWSQLLLGVEHGMRIAEMGRKAGWGRRWSGKRAWSSTSHSTVQWAARNERRVQSERECAGRSKCGRVEREDKKGREVERSGQEGGRGLAHGT